MTAIKSSVSYSQFMAAILSCHRENKSKKGKRESIEEEIGNLHQASNLAYVTASSKPRTVKLYCNGDMR